MKILYIVPNVDGLKKFFKTGNLIDEGMPAMYKPLRYLINNKNKISIIVYPHYNNFKNSFDKKYKNNLRIISLASVEENILFKIIRKLSRGYINLYPALEIFYFTKQIIKINKNLDYDLIYGHDVCGILISYFLNKFYKIPFISRLYGLSFMRRSKGKINLRNKIRYWDKFIPIIVPSENLIITQDGSIAEADIEKNFKNFKNIKLLYNGYDPRFLPDTSKVEYFKKNIISISTLSKLKNVDKIIKILKIINTVDKNWCLTIIGDGQEKQALIELVEKFDLIKNVNFTGRLERKEIYHYLEQHSFFLNLYDIQNLTNTLWESMQMGKCVISRSDSVLMKNIIKNNINGFLFDIDDLESIASKLISLSKNKEKLYEIGKSSQDTVKKLLPTWKDRTEAEINMIKKIYYK